MEMKLNKIEIDNFKGIKHFEADFDGDNATIKAANGVGKTTVYDAFLWLHYGKDSTGRTNFDLRPLDENNHPIPGLVTAVQDELDIDGVTHTFRKENREKVVKGRMQGYENLYFIDEVPKKECEFRAFMDEIIPEDTFKMLTNLRQFNELHWTKRREVLLDIAGEIGTPKGFDNLLGLLKGRSIEDYKKVLAGQKKTLEEKQAEINPRIDEIQRGLDQYAGQDTAKTEYARDLAKGELGILEKKRNELLFNETARQQKIEQVNNLKSQQAARGRTLENDTSGITHLLNEKSTIEQGVSVKRQAVVSAKNAVSTKFSEIQYEQGQLNTNTAAMNDVRNEYHQTNGVSVETSCFACGQTLTADKQLENAKKKTDKLNEIVRKGNGIQVLVKGCVAKINQLEAELKLLNQAVENAGIELAEAETYKTQRIAEIDNLISHNTTTPADKDAIWLDLKKQIETLTAEIGEPVAEQLATIEADRKAKQEEFDSLNSTLANADNAKKAAERIKELEADEKRLAQQIADIDKQLASIESYNTAESNLIESAVNGKFKIVRFKLFNHLINGSIDACCESMLDGVPFSDCSYGQKAVMGIDIVNTLSSHYGIKVPLIIDNSESLTFPIEANSQTIRLFAQKGVKKLTVEIEKQNAKAVA